MSWHWRRISDRCRRLERAAPRPSKHRALATEDTEPLELEALRVLPVVILLVSERHRQNPPQCHFSLVQITRNPDLHVTRLRIEAQRAVQSIPDRQPTREVAV